MSNLRSADLSKYVEPDRVRKECYTDAEVFNLEMERIHETVWIYCGHTSQIPKAGDYVTVQVGRQPMIMVRAKDGKVHVLYNRCPHRGGPLSQGLVFGRSAALGRSARFSPPGW